MKKTVKRKFVATLVFSLIYSIVVIVHGVFFDANWTEISRLSIEGFLTTFVVVFPSLLLLEWIFDLENSAEFKILERRVKNLEVKIKLLKNKNA